MQLEPPALVWQMINGIGTVRYGRAVPLHVALELLYAMCSRATAKLLLLQGDAP